MSSCGWKKSPPAMSGIRPTAKIRDGLIQRFEFTYDLTHKMVRRVIEQAAASAEKVDHMSFPTLIRTANEADLVAGEWA